MCRLKREWHVLIPKKVGKQRQDLPAKQEAMLMALIDDLRFGGPVQGSWPNYSKLGKDRHHCHLHKKWVVCWDLGLGEEKKIIRIYYIGSRKDAPY